MMKITQLCAAALLTILSGFGCGAKSDQPVTSQAEQGKVYYFDFGIERITGLHESEIEKYGSEFCISRTAFEQSLVKISKQAGDQPSYDPLDVRAKVVFSDKRYFVDHAGVVSDGKKLALLDKKRFVDYLKPSSGC